AGRGLRDSLWTNACAWRGARLRPRRPDRVRRHTRRQRARHVPARMLRERRAPPRGVDGRRVAMRPRARPALGCRPPRRPRRAPGGSGGGGARSRGARSTGALSAQRGDDVIRVAAPALVILALASPAHALVLRDMLGRDIALTGPPARIVSLVPSVT